METLLEVVDTYFLNFISFHLFFLGGGERGLKTGQVCKLSFVHWNEVIGKLLYINKAKYFSKLSPSSEDVHSKNISIHWSYCVSVCHM